MVRDEKIKPVDKLMNEKIDEFESGTEKERDKDLDKMIWELGDYESQEPPQEAKEFEEPLPIEEELVEKGIRSVSNGQGSLIEPGEERLPGAEKIPGSAAFVPATEEEDEESFTTS